MQGGKAGMTPLCPVYTIVKEGCCTYKKVRQPFPFFIGTQ